MEWKEEQSADDFMVFLAQRNFPYKEIAGLMRKFYGQILSPNAIGKRLKRHGIPSRRGNTIDGQADIRRAVEEILPEIPETVGYRSLTNILRRKGFHVRRDTVMKILKEVDPIGVDFRRRERIKRRVYQSIGPNFVWHVDGYDKLKPYGFAIHGCIDGYSRKVMWLNVGPSNNDSRIVALNFISCVQLMNGCPLVLQTDPGTENVIMGTLQCVFRHDSDDSFSGINSFRVVRSVLNQRIESWWSMFRRRESQWWITFMKDLETSGLFCRGNQIETYCVRYCFMPLIQSELNNVVEEWNDHHISRSRMAACPNRRPNVLYYMCEEEGGIDCLQYVNDEDVSWALTECQHSSRSGSEEFDTFAKLEFHRHGFQDATTWQEALSHYVVLVNACV